MKRRLWYPFRLGLKYLMHNYTCETPSLSVEQQSSSYDAGVSHRNCFTIRSFRIAGEVASPPLAKQGLF